MQVGYGEGSKFTINLMSYMDVSIKSLTDITTKKGILADL